MKVLYLTTGCFDKGGISRFSRYQITALRSLYGVENIRVLSRLGPAEYDFEEPFDVTWHGRGASSINKLRFAAAVARQAILWRPHLILAAHIHYATLAHRFSRLINARSMLNIYGLEVWTSPGKSCLAGLRNVDRVLADCHNTADYVVEHGLRPQQRPTVIWDPVDVQRFYPADCPKRVIDKYGLFPQDKHFVILSLGRLSVSAAHKGYDRLIKVFARVLETHPGARLVICGRGDNTDNLKSLAAKLEIADLIRFPGGIDEEDLADVYRCGTIFSLVSDRGNGRGEGVPMTPLEAMSCGLPIVVGNQDGSREAVIDDRNGYCIEPFDLENHAEVIAKLISNPQTLADKRCGAIEVAKEVFSYERFVAEHETLFSSWM